jgi:hypothetical protein
MIFNLFKRNRLKDEIIVVSGLPRSGTSLMMKMLEAGGIPILSDGIRKADEDNPKGYYEFERVKELPKGDTAWVKEAKGKAVKVISALLPHLPVLYPYRILFMNRNLDEVLASQRKMLIRRGEDPDAQDDEKLARLYEKHLTEIKAWIRSQKNMKMLEVDYNELVLNPQPQAEAIRSFLDHSVDVKRMIAAVDPSLYRNRFKPDRG